MRGPGGVLAGLIAGLQGERVLDGVVILSRTEGGTPQHVQAVHQDQGASQVLPPFGDRVLHLV